LQAIFVLYVVIAIAFTLINKQLLKKRLKNDIQFAGACDREGHFLLSHKHLTPQLVLQSAGEKTKNLLN